MKVVVTGADGFLGWHIRCRLKALCQHHVVAVGRHNYAQLPELVHDADAIIHVAGVNRAEEHELIEGNVSLASAVAEAVRSAAGPLRVVFANSIQAGNGTPYGTGKEKAAAILREACSGRGTEYVDVMLPNLSASTTG